MSNLKLLIGLLKMIRSSIWNNGILVDELVVVVGIIGAIMIMCVVGFCYLVSVIFIKLLMFMQY